MRCELDLTHNKYNKQQLVHIMCSDGNDKHKKMRVKVIAHCTLFVKKNSDQVRFSAFSHP